MPIARPAASLRTPLCDLLRIRYPILKAGLGGGIDTPELVAAVSAAGGLGVLAADGLTPDQLRAAIQRIKSLSDRPFGVSLVIPSTAPAVGGRLPHQLEVLRAERVPVLTTMGDPEAVIAAAHAAGILVLATVTTVREARAAVVAGADAVVAQGAEAGGRRGAFRLDADGAGPLVGTLALTPQVVDAVPHGRPVVAAGGIMDGRGLAAALALGAAGVLMGTRFSTARESGIAPAWRARLHSATEVDTVVGRFAHGWPARGLRHPPAAGKEWPDRAPPAFPLPAADGRAARGADPPDGAYLPAGQGVGMLTSGDGAARIVAELVTEACARLGQLGALAGETGADPDDWAPRRP